VRVEAATARAVVLVEGVSDQLAVETLARRRERDLSAEGVTVVPIGGSKNIVSFLLRFGPQGLGARLAGLCDDAEERDFSRGLERAGVASNLDRPGMERLGFYVCVEDLEDELIRALGPAAVEGVLSDLGDLAPFRTFQKQPEWQGRPVGSQLRRFLAAGSGRKARATPRLVEALDLDNVPRPLDGVLRHV